MKPFDLKAALAGAPVVTVSDEPVTGLHRFSSVGKGGYSLFGVVNGMVEGWHDNGRSCFDRRHTCSFDLRMAED